MWSARRGGASSGTYAATRARACARRRGISLVGSSSLKAFRPTAVEGIVVRPGGRTMCGFVSARETRRGCWRAGRRFGPNARVGGGRTARSPVDEERPRRCAPWVKRGCDRENTHAQTVIEGNQESRADVQVGRSRSRFLTRNRVKSYRQAVLEKNAETKKTLAIPPPLSRLPRPPPRMSRSSVSSLASSGLFGRRGRVAGRVRRAVAREGRRERAFLRRLGRRRHSGIAGAAPP